MPTSFRRCCEFANSIALRLLTETTRKSLPRQAAMAKADAQALRHFLTNANWSVEYPRTIHLQFTREALIGHAFIRCIGETSNCKKGVTIDYAASQYTGNIHELANGIVSVNGYSVLDTITFPRSPPAFTSRNAA